MTYFQLGKYETDVQVEAARYLGSLDYTDATRIGIFGWSYGGYMSSLCMMKGGRTFRAGIAVAPVTNWKWYDSIYTERYMRTEEKNITKFADIIQDQTISIRELYIGTTAIKILAFSFL